MNDLQKISDLENQLLISEDAQETQEIINYFNANIKKKDILRALKVSDLQDKITSEIDKRISTKGGEFNNRDLLDYYKVLQSTIDNAAYGNKDLSVPTIQINSNIVNVDKYDVQLNRESRQRIFDAVKTLILDTNSNSDFLEEDIEIDKERD